MNKKEFFENLYRFRESTGTRAEDLAGRVADAVGYSLAQSLGMMNERVRVVLCQCGATVDSHQCVSILHTPNFQQNIGVKCRCGRLYTMEFQRLARQGRTGYKRDVGANGQNSGRSHEAVDLEA